VCMTYVCIYIYLCIGKAAEAEVDGFESARGASGTDLAGGRRGQGEFRGAVWEQGRPVCDRYAVYLLY
jgi:hypothetical protein